MPSASAQTNGTIEISKTRVSEYEDMLRREFLSARTSAEEIFEKTTEAKFFGRVNAERFARYEESLGQEDEYFDIQVAEKGHSEARGEDLSPELVVFLMDCSGSMHHIDKELGAFGVALNLLGTEKGTRTVMVVGSELEEGWVDTSVQSVGIGKWGIIDAYETAFGVSNGGNSPTWHEENLQRVDQVLAQYPSDKVKIIVGSDLAIPQVELDFISSLKNRCPVLVVNEIPEKVIEEMGEFVKCRRKTSDILHNDEDKGYIDVEI